VINIRRHEPKLIRVMKASGISLLISVLLRFPHLSSANQSFFTAHDNRYFIGPIDIPFGFKVGGEFSLKVSDFRATTSIKKEQSTSSIEFHPGFLLKRFETDSEFSKFKDDILGNPSICSFRKFIENETVNTDENAFKTNDRGDELFVSMKDTDDGSGLEKTHKFLKGQSGLYFLMYQLCRAPNEKGFMPKKMRSAFKLQLIHKNYDQLGNSSYLTVGEMPLPHVFLYFSISYFILTCFWLSRMKNVVQDDAGSSYNGSGRPTIYAIHHLMSCVLILKTSSMLFESIRYHFIRVNGHAAVWSLMYYLTVLLGGGLLFTVLLLLGSGWSFFKSVLKPREKQIILAVLVLQVINNIVLVLMNAETQGERFYNNWRTILHLFDILCCCAVLVPIVWQINALEKAAEMESNEFGDSAVSLSKVQLFRSFYLLVVGYIYFTRVAVYIFAATLTYKNTWMQYCFTELGTLSFFVAVGVKFRPISEQFYSEVPSSDIETRDGDKQVVPSLEMVSSADEI